MVYGVTVDDKLFPALVGSYCGRAYKVFKCPSDIYKSNRPYDNPFILLSISMNFHFGVDTTPFGYDSDKILLLPARAFVRDSSFGKTSPSDLWVLFDEHPDSIRYPYFFQLYDPAFSEAEMAAVRWDRGVPASYHRGGSALSYADGHADIHKWVSPSTIQPVLFESWDPTRAADRDLRDYHWLGERSTEF